MTLPANVSIHFQPPMIPGHRCVLLSIKLRPGVRAPKSIRNWTGDFMVWCDMDASESETASVALAAYSMRVPENTGDYIRAGVAIVEPTGALRNIRPDPAQSNPSREQFLTWAVRAKNFSRVLFAK